jgi:hypothetical protein
MWYWLHRGPLALHADTEWLMIKPPSFMPINTPLARRGQETQALGHCRGGFTTKLHAVCEYVLQSIQLAASYLWLKYMSRELVSYSERHPWHDMCVVPAARV